MSGRLPDRPEGSSKRMSHKRNEVRAGWPRTSQGTANESW